MLYVKYQGYTIRLSVSDQVSDTKTFMYAGPTSFRGT